MSLIFHLDTHFLHTFSIHESHPLKIQKQSISKKIYESQIYLQVLQLAFHFLIVEKTWFLVLSLEIVWSLFSQDN